MADFRGWPALLLLNASGGSPTSKWATLGVDSDPSLDGLWSKCS